MTPNNFFLSKIVFVEESVVCHRYAIANNEFVPNYNPDDPTTWILFVDANNLYGHGMSQPFPTGNFKFLSTKEIEQFDMSKTAATDDVGLILEVDLKYPVPLHELHNDYPLAAEKIKITHDMLSTYSQSLINKHSSTEKLAPNLNDKVKYVLHYENVRLYLELGMELVKVHRILQFSQSAWIKPYIDFNTTKRK